MAAGVCHGPCGRFDQSPAVVGTEPDAAERRARTHDRNGSRRFRCPADSWHFACRVSDFIKLFESFKAQIDAVPLGMETGRAGGGPRGV